MTNTAGKLDNLRYREHRNMFMEFLPLSSNCPHSIRIDPVFFLKLPPYIKKKTYQESLSIFFIA